MITIDRVSGKLRMSNASVSIETQMGRVSCVHVGKMAEFRNRKYFKSIMANSSIIIGDVNSSWKKIQNVIRTDGFQDISKASYLPSSAYTADGELPMIDHVIVQCGVRCRTQRLRETEQYMDFPRIHVSAGKCPREMMKEMGWCSDHVPVQARLDNIRICTWNVADPNYYYRFNPELPGIVCGFEDFDEEKRQSDVLNVVTSLLERSDILGLQEVPQSIVNVIRERAIDFIIADTINKSENDSSGISSPRLMLFVRSTVI